jgi:hypothetical protein
MKPRTVCACQLVASTISASVTPFARLIIAMMAAFLFVLRDRDSELSMQYLDEAALDRLSTCLV